MGCLAQRRQAAGKPQAPRGAKPLPTSAGPSGGGSNAFADALKGKFGRHSLRAGYSRNRAQIHSSRAVQNLLVPSINKEAYTAGVSWRVNRNSELNIGYELNPRTTLTGTGTIVEDDQQPTTTTITSAS